jgi:inner membrane transporter RhtA
VPWTRTVIVWLHIPVTLTAPPRSSASRVPARAALPVVAVLTAMACVQVGSAVAVPVFGVFGVVGTTWLRLTVAAVVLLAIAPPRGMGRADLAGAGALGVVMAANSVAFSCATDRIPLGTTVAVEVCGPLALAAGRSRGRGPARLLWPALALVGVVLVTRPWRIGDAAAVWQGLGFAAAASVGWALYIVLTARVGRNSEGLRGLSVAVTSAAVVLAPFGIATLAAQRTAGAWGASGDGSGDWSPAGRVVLAALLVPLAAFALEMTALRRLETGVFGVWMALEPAMGTAVGLVLLDQHVAAAAVPGVLLVVLAGIGAARRPPERVDPTEQAQQRIEAVGVPGAG